MGNLHINFTILVFSPTKITSLFYPVSKFSYYCICDTPLNGYCFTHQSYSYSGHLLSSPHDSLQCLYWNRLSMIKLFSKNRMHRILKLELELEQTKPLCIVQCSNEITIAMINMGRKFRGAGSVSNTKSPALRPTSIPSGILMHPAVWPQQKWAENWYGRLRPL